MAKKLKKKNYYTTSEVAKILHVAVGSVINWVDDAEIKAAVITRSINLFENMLKIVHPFMPFITEELWNLIAERKKGESEGK